jgi:NAD(P)-dependent dehydrogenase (short-subunit alcohol dehydrogenase family)
MTSILDRFSLEGRVAIVTGASSGLGVTTAEALAQAGADLVLGARRVERLEETRKLVEQTGRRAHVVPCDVADPEDCERLVAGAIEVFGRLDVLVNNAGMGAIVPALKQSRQDFERILAVNLHGCHWMACEAARVMERGGSIINVSSMLALVTAGTPEAAYGASKAGLLGLTRDLAHEWTGRRDIRVNAVAPGYFATELTEGHDDALGELVKRVATGRLGEADELGAAIVFLASDASSYITGHTLVVDGGFSVG